jgi:putative radical SAM enzyme (TIGR03279 family)
VLMGKLVCGKISKVVENSPAAKLGLRPGDELLSVNSEPVSDVLDFRFKIAESVVAVVVRRNGKRYVGYIFKEPEEDLGVEFEEELFDGLRTCSNNCIFCFLKQMPSGLRESLYIRDDDFRLSFAHGNYITLTNVSEEDMNRICSQKMSPLYVSVHATEPDLRAYMMGNKKAGRIMDQLRRLAEARITVHTQIVLCPGINDGENLSRTVHDLASLHPCVSSIGIVPVGLTKYRDGLPQLRPVDKGVAEEVLESCRGWQAEFKRKLGTRLVYAADEFYLLAGVDFPPANAYEGYPQFENGIGICRVFLDELKSLRRIKPRILPGHYIMVTGVLAKNLVEMLADYLSNIPGVSANVRTVENAFLGDSVTVAGLLSGRDIADALSDIDFEAKVLIPDVAVNGSVFVDGMTIAELESRISSSVTVVPSFPRALTKTLSMPKQKTCAVPA